MSYILDALRRADAERERGAVPGLHSQAVPPVAPEPAPRSSTARQVAAGIGGAIVLLGAAGWFLLRPGAEPAATTAPSVPSAAAPPGPVAPAPQSAVLAAAPSAAPVAPTITPAPTAAMPLAAAPMSTAAPVAPPVPPRVAPPLAAAPAPAVAPAASPSPAAVQAVSPSTPTARTPSPAPAAAQAPTPSPAPVLTAPPAVAAPAPPPRAEPRVINFEQLPEDVRRTIPPVAIGGAIYSDNAASRMLIVGGQLLHEGDSAAPGVTLEQIKPRSAVLRWKELRYEVNF